MSAKEQEGVKPTRCPACGRFLDAATCPGDEAARPAEGDFTCCIGCATILVFDAEREPVLATAPELAAAGPDVRRQLDRVQRAIRKVAAERTRS